MTVREPFAYPRPAATAPKLVADAGAQLINESSVGRPRQPAIHTRSGLTLEYDALGGRARSARATPLRARDHDRRPPPRRDTPRHHPRHRGRLLQSLAFVSPGRMPWQLPLYELALMTAGRAYDMDIDLDTTIITPEDSPLAIFGQGASNGVAERLERSNISTITSAYAEIPHPGEITINPGDRHLHANRVIALPELYGPGTRHPPGRTRLPPHRPTRTSTRNPPHLRRRRRHRLPHQARRPRHPTSRHSGRNDRRTSRRTNHTQTIQPHHPRHPPHRRETPLPHRPHHRRTRLQLRVRPTPDMGAGHAKIRRHSTWLPTWRVSQSKRAWAARRSRR